VRFSAGGATDTMIVKARLPNRTGVTEFLFGTERKSAFAKAG
jgi:hypothetical protein